MTFPRIHGRLLLLGDFIRKEDEDRKSMAFMSKVRYHIGGLGAGLPTKQRLDPCLQSTFRLRLS